MLDTGRTGFDHAQGRCRPKNVKSDKTEPALIFCFVKVGKTECKILWKVLVSREQLFIEQCKTHWMTDTFQDGGCPNNDHKVRWTEACKTSVTPWKDIIKNQIRLSQDNVERAS